MTERFAEVALNRPVGSTFTYRVPTELELVPGQRVRVPFGRRREVGIVVALRGEPGCEPAKVKPVESVLEAEPAVGGDLLELARRIGAHYACGPGQALAAMLPSGLRRGRERRLELFAVARPLEPGVLADLERTAPKHHRLLRVLREAGGELPARDLLRATGLSLSPLETLARRGALALERRPHAPDPLLHAEAAPREPARPRLNDEQAAAVLAIAEAAVARRFETFLLFGVTGSGKTEVYLHALERVLAAGRGGIVLVPEISLTPQTVQRFRARFGSVAVLHSALSDAERAEQWRAIRSGASRVVVGARSAIFAPLADVGLVVVDEEHEPSFKQAQAPRYHARDVAMVRGQISNAAVVLGSATPSLESWLRSEEGSVRRLELRERVAGGRLPPVRIADLRHEAVRGAGAAVPLTRPLREAIGRALERGERVILFLNRRGFAPVSWCRACGATERCPRCAVSLTLHRRIQRLVCHLCRHEAPVPATCTACGAPEIRAIGAGTQRIEEVVTRAFPKAHVARMDSDATISRGSHEAILDRFRRGEIEVLVGTQMLAKGLDVPEVTVVGVVDADGALHVPEYHSAERTFQLVAQVSGRAGRGPKGGEVLVQTSSPEHPAIVCAARHDFETFAKAELEERRALRYPPYTRFVRVLVEARTEERARREAQALAAGFPGAAKGIDVLGPRPAPIERARGRWRWHFLLRCDPPSAVGRVREKLLALALRPARAGAHVSVDVDPATTL